MRSKRFFIVGIIHIFALIFSSQVGYCFEFKEAGDVDMDETEYDKERGERIVENMRFRIAEDRKLEHHGSSIEPEGLDKYFGRKFKKLSDQMDSLSNRVSNIESRLKNLETSIKDFSEQVNALKYHQETN